MIAPAFYCLRWTSLVTTRPTEYGKILCAIKASGGFDYWVAICTYDPAQHRIFVPNDSEAKFSDWILKKNIHWSDAPEFEKTDVVLGTFNAREAETYLARKVDKMLCCAHSDLLNILHEREKRGETVPGDGLSTAIGEIGSAIDRLRDIGESPDHLAGWERH